METFDPHSGWDMDDDEEREAVTCSIARNAAFQILDDAARRLAAVVDGTGTPGMYAVVWPRIAWTMDLAGFSRRTGLRKRPDLNPAFHYHLPRHGGEIVWAGQTYPAPDHWRTPPAMRRRRGKPKPRRNR